MYYPNFFFKKLINPIFLLLRHWEETPDYVSNAYSQLSKPRTNIDIARKGFDGDIIGFKEVIVDDPNLASNNSTSLSRAFGSTKNFVRGSASQFPFAPGGLDKEIVLEEEEVDVDVDTDFINLQGMINEGGLMNNRSNHAFR
jgi:antiviral helicase SKI2